MYLPDVIPRHEQPPKTEDEWGIALESYAMDRDQADYGPRPGASRRQLIPRRGMEASDASDDEADGQGWSISYRRKQAFGIAALIGAPPVSQTVEPDWESGDFERKRMREHYEREGWLRGPTPGYKLSRRRRRMIRLGLGGTSEDDTERRAVISQYAKLAKKMLRASAASVVFLQGDVELHHGMDPDDVPRVVQPLKSLCGLALASHSDPCFVISDVSADWRVASQPLPEKGMKFFASAPLRYLRRHPAVDFGAIMVWGEDARETFSKDEQDMLLELANMLVYQLATLQSEILAERSSNMHEKTLAFWRRSMIPPKLAEQLAKRKGDHKSKRERQERRQKDNTARASEGERETPQPKPRRAPDIVTKSGPKESKILKKKEDEDDAQLFKDAAVTLREILGADSVAFVKMDDYQLFFQRNNALEPDVASTNFTRHNPLLGVMVGAPWPPEYEPIVKHIPAPDSPQVTVLGSCAIDDAKFRFLQSGTVSVLADYLYTFVKTRRFWWDKSDPRDELANSLVECMPEGTGTMMGIGFFTGDGRIRVGVFAGWNRPPKSFENNSTVTLPFIHVLSGIAMGARSVRKQRLLEASQTSYSNLQAHELRTPMHQILAITQLLRTAMTDLAEAPQDQASHLNSIQQIRDLLPILDAIDTSGQTLHGIVDNILSFLDLRSQELTQSDTPTPRIFDSPIGGPRTLGAMFEEIIIEAIEESQRTRRAAMQPLNTIETIFEIDPPSLGDEIAEDTQGSLRNKILSNAYKFIDGEGYVRFCINDMFELEDCEDLSQSKRISIEISDNGVGMESNFVKNHLGEPWAKQDPFTTGSGLSVHLAYRIIDVMGGHMEISSHPNRGTVVRIEIPVLRKSPLVPSMAPSNPLSSPKRKVALVGFDANDGSKLLGEMLARQYPLLDAEICPIEQAELIVANGEVRMDFDTKEVVFLVPSDHVPSPQYVGSSKYRWIAKPITLSALRRSLRPVDPPSHQSFAPAERRASVVSAGKSEKDGRLKVEDLKPREVISWKPHAMLPEEAIACLSLGDYVSSRRRITRTPSASSVSNSHEGESTPATSVNGFLDTPLLGQNDSESETEAGTLKVLVVEDNMINRKIIVRILSTKLPIEILEAADGEEAVRVFRDLTCPCIVLLDINMPKMDGFQACAEFRAIERLDPGRGRAKIIAVTALSGAEEKRRGLENVGFDLWLVKPCGKQKITSVVEEARQELLAVDGGYNG